MQLIIHLINFASCSLQVPAGTAGVRMPWVGCERAKPEPTWMRLGSPKPKAPTAPCERGRARTQGQSSCPNAWASKFLKKIPLVGVTTALRHRITHPSSSSSPYTQPCSTLPPMGQQNVPFKLLRVFFLVLVFFHFFPLGDMFIRKISETSGAACASNSFSKCIMSQE